MLVLSRRERERIKLGDSIIVTVVRVAGDKVRLGIEAPPHILVLRDELEPRAVAGPVLSGPVLGDTVLGDVVLGDTAIAEES
jgi:carbon storage regulator